jgi:hypothetical protein
VKKRSGESKSNSDANFSLGSDELQSSDINYRVSDLSGPFAAAEEPTPPEQEDLTEVTAPLAFPTLSLELMKKMIADAVSLLNDGHLKDLAEKESSVREQALRCRNRICRLKKNLKKVFLRFKELYLSGLENAIEVRKAIAELRPSLAPIPSNFRHNGPPYLTSAEYLVFDAYSNLNKFEKKAIVAILAGIRAMVILHHTFFKTCAIL